MRIKKHDSGNEYLLAGDTWVRNFTKPYVQPLLLTPMFDVSERRMVTSNELENRRFPRIAPEKLSFRNVVIVSDGYRFDDRHAWLVDCPDVCVLAVNGALRRWKLMDPALPVAKRRTMNAYVVNNPYEEAERYLPARDSRYYPTCIASARTSPRFTFRYPGSIYAYAPTVEKGFGIPTKERYSVDDYRNPVCAAIDLAFQFGVKKLMLLCCDDSFDVPKEHSIRLENGLHAYAPQLRSHAIIDAKLKWLTSQKDHEVVVSDYSSGPKYAHASYIKDEEDALAFFRSNGD